MPAPGAPLKRVQAYLSRWGLAQPRPRTLHSQAAGQPSSRQVITGRKRTSDPAALLPPRPGTSSAERQSDEAPTHSPALRDPPR